MKLSRVRDTTQLKRSRKLLSAGLSLIREFKTVKCKSRKYDVLCVKEGVSVAGACL
jgi:hypothetical protein